MHDHEHPLRFEMRALFENVEEGLGVEACDHTLRVTQRWLSAAGHPVEPVVAWFEENGGYCDCEVVMNAQSHWEEIREREPTKRR